MPSIIDVKKTPTWGNRGFRPDFQPAKIATQLARAVTSTWQFRILGAKDNSSPDMAGFANSVMVRYLDYNDIGVGGHPSDSIPGVLAMADYLGSDGQA